MMDENRKLKKLVKEKDNRIERMSTIREKGEMHRTQVLSPDSIDIKVPHKGSMESYDPLRMIRASKLASRERAKTGYLK